MSYLKKIQYILHSGTCLLDMIQYNEKCQKKKEEFKKILNCILQTRLPLVLLIKCQTRTWSECTSVDWSWKMGKYSCFKDCFSCYMHSTDHPCHLRTRGKSASVFCASSQYFLHTSLAASLGNILLSRMEHCLLLHNSHNEEIWELAL